LSSEIVTGQITDIRFLIRKDDSAVNKNTVKDHSRDEEEEGFVQIPVIEKRRITIDSNVIIAAAFSKNDPDNSASQRVIIKCRTQDIPMLTDIIADECLKRARKPNSRVSASAMNMILNEISFEIMELKPIPSADELAKKYKIRDKRDLKILFSADMTDSVIIITQDKDFFEGVEGIKARIIDIYEYDKEGRTCEECETANSQE